MYSIYLDERLGVFKSMRFDPELAGHSTNAADQAHAASRDLLETCGTAELLEKLPMVSTRRLPAACFTILCRAPASLP